MAGKSLLLYKATPAVFYVCIVTVLLTAVCLLQTVNAQSVSSYYYLAVLFSLALGVLHEKVMLKFGFKKSLDILERGLTLTVLIICFTAAISYIICINLDLHVAFLSYIVAFVVPSLVNQSYSCYIQIPREQHKLWFYPEGAEPPPIDTKTVSETDTIPFVLRKTVESPDRTKLNVQSPVDMPIGQLFYQLVYKYNNTGNGKIETSGTADNTFGWLFFVKRPWFKRHFIDPDLSVRQNSIQPGELIYATRGPAQ